MKLFHIYGIEGDIVWLNPWDKAQGFVIRAETEQRAREIASQNGGDEPNHVWLDPEHSGCREITTEGLESVILRDFHEA